MGSLLRSTPLYILKGVGLSEGLRTILGGPEIISVAFKKRDKVGKGGPA